MTRQALIIIGFVAFALAITVGTGGVGIAVAAGCWIAAFVLGRRENRHEAGERVRPAPR